MNKLLFILFAFVLAPKIFAASPTPIPQPTPIMYVLPYPGILPTHPLYILKSLRDKIIEFLITDPLNKAEFHILQADKKLNMGITLKESKKDQEAARAFADSLALRLQVVTLLENYGKNGKVVPGHVGEKLALSLFKHEEVLQNFGVDTKAVHALYLRAQQMVRVE